MDRKKKNPFKPEGIKNIPASKAGLPVAGRDHIQGSIEAPFTLLEYGDFQCPYCGEAYPIVKAIQKRLGDRLCFVFRNFPLVEVHRYAEHAAEAVEAAGAQGKFWEMHDMLFENQEALQDEQLATYADALGLDSRRLLAEVSAGAYASRLREDFNIAVRGGVDGTPTFFVNGVPFDGEPEIDSLLAALTK